MCVACWFASENFAQSNCKLLIASTELGRVVPSILRGKEDGGVSHLAVCMNRGALKGVAVCGVANWRFMAAATFLAAKEGFIGVISKPGTEPTIVLLQSTGGTLIATFLSPKAVDFADPWSARIFGDSIPFSSAGEPHRSE